MVKVKYVGNGLMSCGIKFSPESNGGLYDVSEKDAKYLLDTFPGAFILIEKKTATKTRKKQQEKIED